MTAAVAPVDWQRAIKTEHQRKAYAHLGILWNGLVTPTDPLMREPLEPRHIIGEGKTVKGLERALLLLRIYARYNVRAQKAEYQAKSVSNEWHELTDRVVARLREVIASRYAEVTTHLPPEQWTTEIPRRSIHFGRDRWNNCFHAILYANEVDPFKEWLNGLPAWDGEHRLDHWLSRCRRCREFP